MVPKITHMSYEEQKPLKGARKN